MGNILYENTNNSSENNNIENNNTENNNITPKNSENSMNKKKKRSSLSNHSLSELRELDEVRENINRQIFEISEELESNLDGVDFAHFSTTICKKLQSLEEVGLKIQAGIQCEGYDVIINEIKQLLELMKAQNDTARKRIRLENLLIERFNNAFNAIENNE